MHFIFHSLETGSPTIIISSIHNISIFGMTKSFKKKKWYKFRESGECLNFFICLTAKLYGCDLRYIWFCALILWDNNWTNQLRHFKTTLTKHMKRPLGPLKIQIDISLISKRILFLFFYCPLILRTHICYW